MMKLETMKKGEAAQKGHSPPAKLYRWIVGRRRECACERRQVWGETIRVESARTLALKM
jgi:hypothetical protein